MWTRRTGLNTEQATRSRFLPRGSIVRYGAEVRFQYFEKRPFNSSILSYVR